MLRVISYGVGTCAWSGKEGDGCNVLFDDGSFQGFLGWKSLQNMIRMKSEFLESKKESTEDASEDKER